MKEEKQVLFWGKVLLCTCVFTFISSYIYGAESKKKEQRVIINHLKSKVENRTFELEDIFPDISQKADLMCLNLNALSEAGDHKERLMIAKDAQLITSSVINRMKENGQTACEVVYSKCGKEKRACYSWTAKKQFPKTVDEAKKYNREKWETVTRINEAILSGRLHYVEDIKWYVNHKIAPDAWAMDKYNAGEFVIADQVGNHIFFKMAQN
jgi:hypothetical protein